MQDAALGHAAQEAIQLGLLDLLLHGIERLRRREAFLLLVLRGQSASQANQFLVDTQFLCIELDLGIEAQRGIRGEQPGFSRKIRFGVVRQPLRVNQTAEVREAERDTEEKRTLQHWRTAS